MLMYAVRSVQQLAAIGRALTQAYLRKGKGIGNGQLKLAGCVGTERFTGVLMLSLGTKL